MPNSETASFSIPRIALAIAIGTFGGGAFFLLNLPLPWMLGSMVACLVSALLKLPIQGPMQIRPIVVPIIGVMLGSGFDTQTFSHMVSWSYSLAGLIAYIALSAAVVIPFFMKFGSMDRTTAFFSGMPGGLSEMMLIGASMGGDEQRIILSHAARIVATVFVIAFFFRVILGYDVSGVVAASDTKEALTPTSAVILLACAVFGYFLAKRLRLPAAGLLGPMVLSAIVHMTGLSSAAPPQTLVIIAQIVMGAVMGARFLGADPKLVVKTFGLSLCATLVMLVLSLAFAWGLAQISGTSIEQTLLAYAPGGLTEMSLVAISMDADVAYISIHHLARIVLIIAFAPVVLKLMSPWFLRQ